MGLHYLRRKIEASPAFPAPHEAGRVRPPVDQAEARTTTARSGSTDRSTWVRCRTGLCSAYDALGFPRAARRDEVFRQLVLAQVIEPPSKLDSLRVGTPRRPVLLDRH